LARGKKVNFTPKERRFLPVCVDVFVSLLPLPKGNQLQHDNYLLGK
jgi:hypothetical protein